LDIEREWSKEGERVEDYLLEEVEISSSSTSWHEV
jgi:hypothetical protein